jgi:hypothetical protein
MSDLKTRAPPAVRYPDLHADIANFLNKGLFFIGSNPKSGSTWLQVMLNAHPDISCHGEGHFIDHLAPALRDALKKHSGLINLKNKTIFNELPPYPSFDDVHFRYLLTSAIVLLLMRPDDSRAAHVIGEKTPNNLIHFALLDALFPHAKFVHMVRDGRDCAVSAWFHNMRTNPTELLKRHHTFEQFVQHIAHGWKIIVAQGHQFCAARPDRCLTIRYSDLSLRPLETMTSAFRFLGVTADERIVARCVADGAFEKMSGGRMPGVEDRSSFMRMGQSGNWRQYLTPDANRAFLATAGDVMRLFGFDE